MEITQLLESVQYVTNSNGKRQAVLLDLDIWKKVVAVLQRTVSADSTPVTEDEIAIEREEAAYQAMHHELYRTHAGQHVAIYGGQLVDHDTDGTALYKRVRHKYKDKFVLITPVEETAQEVYVVRSPRLILND